MRPVQSDGSATLQVLLIEDTPGDARLFEERLRKDNENSAVQWEKDLETGIELLEGGTFDVVAVDLGLPDSEGTETIERLRAIDPEVPIVVLTEQENEDLALATLQVGATEFLRKTELESSLLSRTLRWAVERNSMERRLRKRERELRSIAENISQGIYRSAPDEGLIYANQAFADLFGYENPKAVLEVDPMQLYANPARRRELRKVLRTDGRFENAEVEFRRRDGSTFTGLLSGTVMRDETGEIVSFDGAVTDVSERREAQDQLEASEERVRSVLDAVAANVAVIDRKGEIIDVNERWTRFAEKNDGDPDRLGVGANYLSACAPAEREANSAIPAVRAEIRAVAEGREELFEYEYPCHSADEERWFLLRATPLQREEGGAVVAHINITDRVKAVRVQRVLSKAVEQSNDAVLITGAETGEDPGPQIRYVNSALEAMTGYSEEELLGKTPRVLQGPETDREVLDSLRDALEAEESWEGETVNYRKDGTPYVVQWSVAPVRDADGEVEYWVSVQRDVTEQREREEALRQNRNLLNQTQRLAGAWQVDLQSGELVWSDEVYRVHEVDPGTQIMVRDGIDFYAPEAQPKIREAFERCAEEGEPFDLELPLNTAKGSRRWVRTVGAPSEVENGDVVQVSGALQDITDRKEAEQALKESEELHRATLSNITDAVLLTRADGTFSYVCPNVGYIFGYTEEEVEALGSISALLGSDPIEEHDFEGRDSISNVEHSVVDASGERHDLLINIRRVSIQDGRRMYTCRDITERKQAEEALREREEYLSVTLQSIGDAVVATDRDGCITEMNPVAERLTGWGQEEAKGKLLDDVLVLHSARTGERVESPAERVLRGGRTLGLGNRTILTARDGTEYQIANSAAPIESAEGDLLGVVLVFRDVTEKYERRRRMERQNDLFAKAQDLANVGGWEYDVRSDKAVWTEEVYQIHGLSPDAEVSPEQSLQFYHEEDRPVIEEAFARAVEEAEPYDLELRLNTGEGDERWVRTRGEPQTVGEDVIRVRGTIQDVTDQKKHEDELERMTNLLRLAEQMTDVGGWSVDVRGEPPYQAEWTDHLYEIFGLSPREEPPTEEVFEYYHPEDRERHREVVYRAEQTGESWDQELRLIRADGTERWVHNIGVPISEEGEVVEIRGAIQDITERKNREKRLEEMRDRMVLALDQTSSIVFEIDLEADQISRMGAYETFFGMPSEDVETREQHVDRAVHPEDRAGFREFYGEFAAGERRSGTFEYRTNPERGEVRWIRDIVHRIEGEERLLGLARDVTVRKEQRERLRFLAEALEQVGDKVVITDHEGRIEFVNEAFERITGFEEEKVLGKTPNVLQSGLHDDAFYTDLWDTILAGDTFRAEIVNERKDGTTYVEDETISPVVNADGDVTHFVSTGRDVTERKERERELKDAKEEAERMNRLKSAFLANMSHEIRTPLTSILGFAEIIDEEVTGLDPSDVGVDLSVLSRYSGLIQKSGRRLMDTLEGVLDLSKLEAGEMNLSDEPIELTVEITELVDEFEPQAKDAEVDLQSEATERPVRVDADPGGVRMAIGNLVSNAIKYTPSGGSVCVRVWEDGADACVEVEDTGIGMDPDLVPELFEAFVQESEGMDREFEGSGLGLAVTKKVLDQLGASIEVETEKGEGSRFTVRLPRAEE